MRNPEGYLWEYPGLPSISVSYLHTNDFFFSGHVGFPTIFALEHNTLGNTFLKYLCIFTAFFEFTTMIITRGRHYIIDFSGIIIAHYLYNICSYISENYIDDSWMSLKQHIVSSKPSEYKEVPTTDIEKSLDK